MRKTGKNIPATPVAHWVIWEKNYSRRSHPKRKRKIGLRRHLYARGAPTRSETFKLPPSIDSYHSNSTPPVREKSMKIGQQQHLITPKTKGLTA
jgi:hypothetical protein